MPNISLITGVPRSGTTLSCKLLNSVHNAVALHEPLDPQKIVLSTHADVLNEIHTSISAIRERLLNGDRIEHGDGSQLVLDNPISDHTAPDTTIRQASAKRGLLRIAPIDLKTRIFIKQNAMFAALAKELKTAYPLVAIVRNPIDVLTSWMTVNLPVNQGRIPGGERFSPPLKHTLDSINNTVARQVTIYHWFLSQYLNNGLTVLKYEDIIATKGVALFDACQVAGIPDDTLLQRHANRPELKGPLTWVAAHLDYKLMAPFYTKSDIEYSLAQTTANGSPD